MADRTVYVILWFPGQQEMTLNPEIVELSCWLCQSCLDSLNAALWLFLSYLHVVSKTHLSWSFVLHSDEAGSCDSVFPAFLCNLCVDRPSPWPYGCTLYDSMLLSPSPSNYVLHLFTVSTTNYPTTQLWLCCMLWAVIWSITSPVIISSCIFQVVLAWAGVAEQALWNKAFHWPVGVQYAWKQAEESHCWLFNHFHFVLQSRKWLSRGQRKRGGGGKRQRRREKICRDESWAII